MRRIPRLRRPSGLTPSSSTNIRSGSTPSSTHIAPYSQRSLPAASQPSSSTPAFASRRTAPASVSPRLNRFYSASPEKPQQSAPPTTYANEEHAQEEPTTELQSKGIPADELVSPEEAEIDYDLVDTNFRGPYTVPPERFEAARVDEVADPTYAPAERAAGLKKVGGLADWWDRRENWGAAGDFVGFKPRDKIVEPPLIEAAVRRAVIEAFALRQAGREDELVGVWPTTVSKADLQSLLARDVQSAADGTVALGGNAATVAEGLRWKDEATDAEVALPEPLTVDEAAALSQTWNPSWKAISLAGPRIRFAVTKRIFQLTGQLVPDHQFESITTVQTLLHVLKKPPKPATLTQEIQKRHPELLDLPNVTVAPKRLTRGDKEVALGRFKLMQKEFKKRDIPAHGHGWTRKGKEISRARGEV
ncbi:ribosomal subunit 39S-domain-containing protein [Xylaria arbuscula]|nr:ribosomal subunit 39S-domain-containing protein [Xylaria arbuscula]